MNEGIDKYMAQVVKAQDEIFEFSLRNDAIPPIKGNITKGKIKWRGIRMCQTHKPYETLIWLEQRGKKIGKLIVLKAHCEPPSSTF